MKTAVATKLQHFSLRGCYAKVVAAAFLVLTNGLFCAILEVGRLKTYFKYRYMIEVISFAGASAGDLSEKLRN